MSNPNPPSAPSEQRRRFSRVLFNASAHLLVDLIKLRCEVHDLSLKGALLRLASGESRPASLAPGLHCTLELRLDADDIVIIMNCMVSHVEADNIGLRCESIDLDSVSHLRRLVELNVGDEAILQRELSALISLA